MTASEGGEGGSTSSVAYGQSFANHFCSGSRKWVNRSPTRNWNTSSGPCCLDDKIGLKLLQPPASVGSPSLVSGGRLSRNNFGRAVDDEDGMVFEDKNEGEGEDGVSVYPSTRSDSTSGSSCEHHGL